MPAVATFPKSMSVAEAAEEMGVNPKTISRLIWAKKLKATKMGSRVIVRGVDLQKYCDDHPAA